MASETLHEVAKDLSRQTRDMHRALVSLNEELDAVDWYRQRADACDDAHLKAILLHNMREEIEHAAMLIEWLRRNDSDFQNQLETYMFSEAPVTEVEERSDDDEAEAPDDAPPARAADAFTVGSLKE
jgi:ferritin-like protein